MTSIAETARADGTKQRVADLARRREQALAVAPDRAVARQRERGRLTARTRVERLVDAGSFTETDAFVRARASSSAGGPGTSDGSGGAGGSGGDDTRRPYGDGVVTGFGTIDGRPVCVFAQDATVFGGSLGRRSARRSSRSWTWR